MEPELSTTYPAPSWSAWMNGGCQPYLIEAGSKEGAAFRLNPF